jgi:hypothetical protein
MAGSHAGASAAGIADAVANAFADAMTNAIANAPANAIASRCRNLATARGGEGGSKPTARWMTCSTKRQS